MDLLIVAFGLLLFSCPNAFAFGPFKTSGRLVDFKTRAQVVDELRALARRGRLFMYGGRVKCANPRGLSIKRAWSRPKLEPRRGASFAGQLDTSKDRPREKVPSVAISGDASIGGGRGRLVNPWRLAYLACLLVMASSLYFIVGPWSSFLPIFMAIRPTPYESWSGGYLRVDGKDIRANTSYMWGHILAATDIRISSEFDSPTSTTAGIQEAINDLPATGGVVLVPPGTHSVSNPSITNISNLTLMGLGPASIIQMAAGTNLNAIEIPVGSARVNIRDLHIDGQSALNPAAGNGIYGLDCDDLSIQNVEVEDCRGFGIYMDRSVGISRVTVSKCHVYDCINSGMQFSYCEDSLVEGCRVHDNDVSGISLNNSNRVVIQGNNCYDNFYHGITISACYFDLIQGNTTYSNTQEGIYLNASQWNTIEANISTVNTRNGIYLRRSSFNLISNNHVDNNGNTYDGIRIFGDATTNSDFNRIVDNYAYNAGDQEYGVNILGGADANKNVVNGNTCYGNVTGPINDEGADTVIDHNLTS